MQDPSVGLAERGRLDLIRAWLDGRVSLAQLVDARDTDRTGELTEALRHEDVPVSEAIRAMIRAKTPDVKPSTLDRYQTGLAYFERLAAVILDTPTPTVASALTTDTIRTFKGLRAKEGRKPETINNDLLAISILVTYALDDERCWIAKRPKIKKFPSSPKTIWLERPDVAAYMANLRPAFRPLMQVLIGTGVRLGEAESLRVCDVRFSPDGCTASIEDAKTVSGVRIVSVPDWCADVLRARIDAAGLDGAEPVFDPIPRRSIQKEHRRTVKAAGIRKDYTIHRHRDTFGVSMARAGMPLGVLQHQLGHSTIKQTIKYAKLHPDYQDAKPYFKRASERLGLHSLGDTLGDTPQPTLREQVRESRKSL